MRAKENPPRKVAAGFPGPDLLHAFGWQGHACFLLIGRIRYFIPFDFTAFRPSPLRSDCTRPTGRPGIEGVRGEDRVGEVHSWGSCPKYSLWSINSACNLAFSQVLENSRGLSIPIRAHPLSSRTWAGEWTVVGTLNQLTTKTSKRPPSQRKPAPESGGEISRTEV